MQINKKLALLFTKASEDIHAADKIGVAYDDLINLIKETETLTRDILDGKTGSNLVESAIKIRFIMNKGYGKAYKEVRCPGCNELYSGENALAVKETGICITCYNKQCRHCAEDYDGFDAVS